MTSANALPLYTYCATVIRWVDGDTVWLRVDLGFRHWMECDFRLFGIDTPERGKTGYAEATAYARTHAPVGAALMIKTYKDPDKYGRWLADLFVDGDSLNIALVATGNAVSYFGGTKAPAGVAYLKEDGSIVEERERPSV